MRTQLLKLNRSADRSYPIVVGSSLLSRVLSVPASRYFIVADRRLLQSARELQKLLQRAGKDCGLHTVTASEATKSLPKTIPLYGRLIQAGLDRQSVLVALGGGVVTDLTGFLAATYLRGVRWVAIPTTLLAQADAAIGGKTGVNHDLGKNLVGAFHQPSLVLCDSDFLGSLSERDRVSGYAEIAKCGIALDAPLYRRLVKDQARILALTPGSLVEALGGAIRVKASLVSRDEKETTGERRKLNFGHTIGHALEAMTDFRLLRHGEAVVYGMRAAVGLSVLRGHLAKEKGRELENFLAAIPVPNIPPVSLRLLMKFVARDKKASQGKVPFVLLSKIGKTVVDREVTADAIGEVLHDMGVKVKA